MTCRREPPPRVVTRRYSAAPEVGDTVLHDGRPAVVMVVYHPGRRLHGAQLDCAPRCDCNGILAYRLGSWWCASCRRWWNQRDFAAALAAAGAGPRRP